MEDITVQIINQTTDINPEIQNVTTSTEWTLAALSLEDETAIILWKVWPTCLLLLGSFGNIATISVMRRIKDKNSSQHVILMVLAVCDLTLLYVGLLRQWIYYFFHVELYDLHAVLCKVCWWLLYATSTSSSWLLMCVTVQRTMAVKWPHKMKMMCSLQRTWIVIAAVVTFGCTLHLHFVFGMVISDGMCTFMSIEYDDFVMHVWAWVDLTVFTLIPFLCLLICDVILSMTLFEATSSSSMVTSSMTNSNSSRINESRRRTASRTTIMILALSCTFLVLTMPVCIYHILEVYVFAVSSEDSYFINRDSVATAVTILLWYTNSAVNFLLYCFTGTKFRKEFLRWICCDSRVDSNASINNLSSGLSHGTKNKQR